MKNIPSSGDIYQSNISIDAKLYKEAQVINSIISSLVTIGDQSIIVDSRINNNTSINRRNYILRSKIGSYTYTGIGSMVRSSSIGNFCSISWNVSVGGGNHDHSKVTTSPLSRFYELDSGKRNQQAKLELSKTFEKQSSCTIGNDVLISSGATILRGLEIGNGAVIGAGAVVTRDVEPYSIVAGVPAEVIKMRFEGRVIEALQKIQWWSWPPDIIRENLKIIYSTDVDDKVVEQLIRISETI